MIRNKPVFMKQELKTLVFLLLISYNKSNLREVLMMGLIIIYFVVSILLFFLLNYVRKYHDDVIHYGIVTGIYVLIITGIVTSKGIVHKDNFVYVIFLLELFIRIFYESMFKDVNFFKERDYISRYIFSFLVVLVLNVFFISHVKNIFPSIDQIRFMIWMGVFVYIVFLFKNDIEYFKKKKSALDVKDQNKESIVIRYARLKNQYSKYVHSKYLELVPVIYAIMVYEDKNRPELVRKFDYLLFKVTGKGRKFGIMQIYSQYYIDDYNSISLGIKRLEKIYSSINSKRDIYVVRKYYGNTDIEKEVMSILKIVKEFDKK